jgi:hypothetical protein
MASDHILRKDSIGRVVVTRERRAALLEEFDRSGMSGGQFAKWAGIKYQTFAYWVQQRRKEQARKEGGEKIKTRASLVLRSAGWKRWWLARESLLPWKRRPRRPW